MTADEIEMDNRTSTAGYLPTSPSNMSTPSGYVPCQEKHIYPGNYGNDNTIDISQFDVANQNFNQQRDTSMVTNERRTAPEMPSDKTWSWGPNY